jgi:hypothetical protein
MVESWNAAHADGEAAAADSSAPPAAGTSSGNHPPSAAADADADALIRQGGVHDE